MDSATKGSPMDAVMSFFKNPAGGAADVNLDETGKMAAGGIMGGIGFAGILVGILISGIPLSMVIGNLVVAFLVIFALMFAMSFIGAQIGAGENKTPGEGLVGAGACSMFLGVVVLLIMLLGQILSGRSAFMGVLTMTIYFGLILMIGTVSYGVWTNRYKVAPMVASVLAGFTISVGLFFGMWISSSIMGGGNPMGMLGRMF